VARGLNPGDTRPRPDGSNLDPPAPDSWEYPLSPTPNLPPWVFVTTVGTPLDESKVRKSMPRASCCKTGSPRLYVQRQLGHASIQLTVDTYGKWLPMENKGAVDRLDKASDSKSQGTAGGGVRTC